MWLWRKRLITLMFNGRGRSMKKRRKMSGITYKFDAMAQKAPPIVKVKYEHAN
jgi:hypothetical protein